MRKTSLPLLLNDLLQIRKDPMLMAALLGPIALIVVARWGFPPLAQWLEAKLAVSINTQMNRDLASAFLLLVIPLLPGTMAGLLMLDERDEHLIAYYAATPLARRGYLLYRLTLPTILSFLLAAAFLGWSGLTRVLPEHGYAVLLYTLEAPCMAIFLAAYAGNKVEGLALSKISGLLFAGPVTAAFIPVPWQYAAAWIPSFWPAKVYLAAVWNEPVPAAAVFGAGLLLHLLLLAGLLRKFANRND